ncbi:MAG: peptidase S41, partial [Planctomycetaceae bacterium]
MWIGDKIYFVSDRTGTLNLFSTDLATDETKQLTHSTEADVRWASSDNRRWIIYESLGELAVFDTTTSEEKKISIQVPDDGLARRPSRVPVDKFIEEFDLSPRGERALFVARGDVFTAPIEKGVPRNLTHSSRSHDRGAAWSPEGARIAYISDASGEDQVWLVDQEGAGKPEPQTNVVESMLFALRWSPDGQRLAFSDKLGKLHVLTIADKTTVEVADERRGLLTDFAWSPCGGHLAIRLSNSNELSSLWIWSVADNQLRRTTSELFDAFSPAWDPKGEYLFFLSRRQFAPQISSVEWNFAGNRGTGIFGVALRKDVKNLFAPESDEVQIAVKPEPAPARPEGDKKPEEAKPDAGLKPAERVVTKIEFEGLADRVIRVPVEADNLGQLSAVKGHLLYTVSGARFYGRDSSQKTRLQIFDLAKREAATLVDDVAGHAVSADGSKVLVRSGAVFSLVDVKPKGGEKKPVSTNELAVDRVPVEEFAAVFDEVWRRYRDFFYVRNMHGYDWKAIGDRYRKLLPHVAHRSDLNYVLGEMIAELNAGHCYIEGGDFELPERPRVGLPGARFELDPAVGRYRIAAILRGENEEEKYRSPLTEVGIDVAVGDYVLAIDGQELNAGDDPYRLLRHKSQLVTLTVNKAPVFEGARKVA